MKRSAAYDRLERVSDELESARFALSVIVRDWHRHLTSAIKRKGQLLSLGDLQRCLDNLEPTYIVRLFATFEGILRDYWAGAMRRKSEPTMTRLMDRVAARRRMDAATLANAHEIREFRNEIVHENVDVLVFDFGQCGKRLGNYLSWLPVEW